ncbi:MAG: hypothetical protein ABL974_18900 [Prosthecobacter sp.]
MPTNLESTIERLQKAGCVFPISRDELHAHRVYDILVLRELARKGLIKNPELYDSNLSDLCLNALEYWGVTSREHFRKLYRAGQINLSRARMIGPGKAAQILRWAGLPPQPDAKEPVSFQLSVTACEGLQQLKKHMDLPTRDLVMECLIADAVRAIGTGDGPEKP